ncbi:MAG: class I SAM-dependent methyltransferase [Candidatus Neomarinimicrobiota bacterium]|nr:MAG: class I SAM-dependent methyltransferase [Candidatus Neomarinimicrobiota bacterium]
MLELGAGTGRLAVPFCQAGFEYTGLEQSEPYAAWARTKLERQHLNGAIVVGDMRQFDLPGRFDFIFVGFNSFLHLLTDEEARDCLACVRRHLSAEGRFLLDVFVPASAFLHRDPDRFYPVKEFHHPRGGTCTIRERTTYDPVREVLDVTWYFFREDDPPERYRFSMRMLFPDTVERLLAEAGFRIVAKLGSYAGEPLTVDSPLQITIACA